MRASIQERFEIFHRNNPRVYAELVSRSLAYREHRGPTARLGIELPWEVIRWDYEMGTIRAEGEFKLCNDYTSRYSRLIMEQEPLLKDAYETRELREVGHYDDDDDWYL